MGIKKEGSMEVANIVRLLIVCFGDEGLKTVMKLFAVAFLSLPMMLTIYLLVRMINEIIGRDRRRERG
jgi:hypothetical protein